MGTYVEWITFDWIIEVLSLGAFPRTDHGDSEREWRYISTTSLNPAVGGDGWSNSRLGRLVLGEDNRYPLCRRLGGSKGRSGRVWKMSPPLGFDPRAVQAVVAVPGDLRSTIRKCICSDCVFIIRSQLPLAAIAGSNPTGGVDVCL